MSKSCYYAELYQKKQQATGAALPSFDLFLVFYTLTKDKVFHSPKHKIPLRTWKARWSPLNMVALKLVGDLNAEEMLDVDIRVFDIEL